MGKKRGEERNIKSLEKKGMIHVEVTLAFVIFLIGISLSVFFFTPIQGVILHRSVVLTLRNNFLENVTSDLYLWTYTVNSSDGYCCLLLPGDFDENHIMLNGLNFNITDLCQQSPLQEYYVISECVGKNIVLTYSEDEELSDFRSRIYSSVTPTASLTVNSPGKRQDVISWNRLMEINNSYYNNYENLKNKLIGNVNADFSVIVRNSTSTLLAMSKKIPENVVVASSQVVLPIQMGNNSFVAFFDFLVW